MKLKLSKIIVFLCFFATELISGSNFKARDTILNPMQIADSLVFSNNLDWSVRLVGNFKQQQFGLLNDQSKLNYRPNNPFGAGFGIANQNIVIDVVFNIKGGEEDVTEKFAAEGALIVKEKNLIGFSIENVHGYEVISHQTDEKTFRDDISVFSIGLEYLRILSKHKFTIRGMKAGLKDQDRSFVSYGVGGFTLIENLDADYSIVPEEDEPYFNEEAQIYDTSAFGAGILGGVSAYFNLPSHFFATAYVAPGIGLEYSYIKTESGNYIPSDPLIYKTDFFGSLGYNRKKFYIHFTFGTDLYYTSLGSGNKGFLSVTKSKFVIGYQIGKIGKKR